MWFAGFDSGVVGSQLSLGWHGVTALLFGMRHLPMDVYTGLSQQAPPLAWISKMLQLYLGAAVFGVARHQAESTWASWIVHEGFLLLIVLLSVPVAYGE